MTLLEFVVDSGMEPSRDRAFGAIQAGRYVVGRAWPVSGGTWALDRPFGCLRVTDPLAVLRTPCVVRGGWKTQKVSVAT